MKTSVCGNFFVDTTDGLHALGLTQQGLKSFGSLFVCEPLLHPKGTNVTNTTKLFCVEGMNKLECIISPFKSGKLEKYVKFSDPSEIRPNVPLVYIKGGELDALSFL